MAVTYGLVFCIAAWFYMTVWPYAPVMVPDSPGYLALAHDLSDLSLDRIHTRAPGYPAFLVLSGATEFPNRTLFFASLLLHFTAIWLLASLLCDAGMKVLTVILFGLVLLLPPYVEPAAYVLSENLAEAMLVIAFVGLIFWLRDKKTIWIVLSSIAVASAALTRPTYQALALTLASSLAVIKYLFSRLPLKWEQVMKASSILIFVSVSIHGSYALINYQKFGYFGVAPRLGLTLSTKTWRFIERLPDEYASIKEILIEARNTQLVQHNGEHDGSMSVWAAVPELRKVTGLEDHLLSAHMFKLNMLLIQSAPLHYVREVVWAFGTYWFPSSTILANFDSRVIQLLWAALHFVLISVFAVTLALLAGIAVFLFTCWSWSHDGTKLDGKLEHGLRLIQSNAFMLVMASTIVIYTSAVSCLVEVGNPRYRVPTDSLIIFVIFIGTNIWRQLIELSRSNFVISRNEV
jgi:hypothetical protein